MTGAKGAFNVALDFIVALKVGWNVALDSVHGVLRVGCVVCVSLNHKYSMFDTMLEVNILNAEKGN
jgi:hypothetical protein